LKKKRLEGNLILQAIETGNIKEAANNLNFFIKTGFLQDKKGAINDAVYELEAVPVLPSPAGMIDLVTPQQRLDHAVNELAKAKNQEERFYALSDVAKESFVTGNIEDARKYAKELMTLLPEFKGNWNYGNAVQDANLVLGRIAVTEGRIDDAKRYLIEAGRSPGSPQMNSFGPNMSLAKDLLEKGERDVVLEYFELCRKFWEMHGGQLDEWSRDVKTGKIPNFGANLLY
jgi:tetratricopeptide (TPR) repeat protein